MAAAKSAIGTGPNDIGDLQPVKPADPRVIEVGKFAVKEHNEQEKTQLIFVAVVGGFMWARFGATHYALIIETQDDTGATYIHKALVLVLETYPTRLELIWYKN